MLEISLAYSEYSTRTNRRIVPIALFARQKMVLRVSVRRGVPWDIRGTTRDSTVLFYVRFVLGFSEKKIMVKSVITC